MSGSAKYDKDIQVVVLKKTYPHLQVRFLSDRDKGQVVWESAVLDDAGTVVQEDRWVLGLHHLLHLEGLLEDLMEARKALTPRKRVDKHHLAPPLIAGGV